jgi:hypothetical protein
MYSFSTNLTPVNSDETNVTFVAGDLGGAGTLSYTIKPWYKPVNCNFVHFICFGPGGWGGAGWSSASFPRPGGGGGGSAGVTSTIYHASLIPDVVYLVAGNPLPGLAPGATQSQANYISAVVFDPSSIDSADTSNFLNIGFGGGGGTSAGGSAIVGTAGAAGATATITTVPYMRMSLYNACGGMAGSAGSNSLSTSASVNMIANGPTTGGVGGGWASTNLNMAGTGNITAPSGGYSFLQTLNGLAAGSTTDGFNGFGGVFYNKPLHGTGGGGGNAGSSTGGKGGNGAFGCGGGGGGGGNPAGNGGDGGPGLVVVNWW